MKKVLRLLTLTTLLTTSLSTAPIHDAAQEGDFSEVERLINEDPTCVHDRGGGGFTPLHWAARNGRMEIVQLLFAHGAVVNTQDHNGDTPLHCAAWGGHAEVAGFLLAHGANVVRDHRGLAPLNMARQLNYPEVIELLAVVPLLQSLREQAYQACSGTVPAR